MPGTSGVLPKPLRVYGPMPVALAAFELANLWSDRTAWPIDERTHYDELSELAVMSALGRWLRRWQPVAIHGAILAGARSEAVAGAMGNSTEVAFGRWYEWAMAQRDFLSNGKPGITEEEHETVARRFAAVGVLSAKPQPWRSMNT